MSASRADIGRQLESINFAVWIREPHRVPRKARIRTFIFLENGVNIPPPAQSCIVLPNFRAQTNTFSKYLIISLLPVEEVPVTPLVGTGGF